MRAIFNTTFKWSRPYGLKPKKQLSNYKVRKFSKKITLPPEQAQEKKDKFSNYLITIPPWMKKEINVKPKESAENKELIRKTGSNKSLSNKDHQTSTYMKLQGKTDNANNRELINSKSKTNKDKQTSNYKMLQAKNNNTTNKEVTSNKLPTNKDNQTSNYTMLQARNNTTNKEVISNKPTTNKDNQTSNYTMLQAKNNNTTNKEVISNKPTTNKDNQTSNYTMLQAKNNNTTNKEVTSNKLPTNKDNQTSNYTMLQARNNTTNKEVTSNKVTTNKDNQTSNYTMLQAKKNNTTNKEVVINKVSTNNFHNTSKLQGKQDNASNEVSNRMNILKNKPTIAEDSVTSVLLRKNKLQTCINKLHTDVPNKEKQQSNITKKESNKNQNTINEKKNKNNSLMQSKFKPSNENKNNLKIHKTLSTNLGTQKAFSLMNLSKLNQEQTESNKKQVNKIIELSDIASANVKGKVQTEQNKQKNINTAVKVGVKSIELIEESEHFSTSKKGKIPLKESKLSKLSKTKSENFNELKEIKVYDTLLQDILQAKEKIAMKKTESENLILNKSNKKEVGSNKNDKRETNLNKEVINATSNDVNKNTDIVAKSKTLKESKKKTTDTRDHAIVKLTSNPLKLNSNESLFAYNKNKQLKKAINKNELKMKNEIIDKNIASMRIKMQTIKKRSNNNYQRLLYNLSGNKKNENSVNNNILKQKYLSDGTKKRNTSKIQINDLSAQKTIQFHKNKDKNLKAKQKPLQMNKSTLQHANIMKKNIPANSIRRINDTNLERSNTPGIKKMLGNSQNEWYKSIKNITPKPPSLKAKPLNTSDKKPVFISKIPAPKVNKIKFNIKNCKANLKQFRPVFGPPSCDHDNPSQNKRHSSDGSSNNNNNDNGDSKNFSTDCNRCVGDTKTNEQDPFNKDNYIQDQCIDSSKNKQQLLTKLYTFLNNFRETVMCYFPILDILQRKLKCYLTKTGNKPIDNLNISLLRTDNEKQPIYICDKYSYLFKCPTIYQKLYQKLITFSHLIKNREDLKPKDINTVTGIPLIKCQTTARESSSNLKTSCIKKKRKLDTLGVTITTECPKKSYSEVLSNLFAKHLQQRTK